MNKKELARFQERLAALQKERKDFWDKTINPKFNALEADRDQRRAVIWAEREAGEAAINVKVRALYIEATGKFGIKEGDIVRVVSAYGDNKAGEWAEVEKLFHDNDYNRDMVTLNYGGTVSSIETWAVVLELDKNAADRFRLTRALRYIGFQEGSGLLNTLYDAKNVIAAWIERLEGET